MSRWQPLWERLSASGASDPSLNTLVSGTGSNLTLVNGIKDNQQKVIVASSGSGQITPANFGNGTKMTWSAAGQSCTLRWDATLSKWWLIANVGMTVV